MLRTATSKIIDLIRVKVKMMGGINTEVATSETIRLNNTSRITAMSMKNGTMRVGNSCSLSNKPTIKSRNR